jgi:muramoyltetrapeptide carboxypeptidase
MITPPYLKKGDTVAVLCPAGKMKKEHIEGALKILNNWGLELIVSEGLFSEHFMYSADDEHRRKEFQNALDDNNIRAIFCCRGGYGSVRIIDLLDFAEFRKNPKWIIGFSDITLINSHVNRLGYESIHGPMPVSFGKDPVSTAMLRKVLFGSPVIYDIPAHSANVKGHVSGFMTGGNLSILHNIRGSVSEPDMEGAILFLEDIGEYLYNMDRMLWGMERSGKFKGIQAVIAGDFNDMKEGSSAFGKDATEIILEHFGNRGIPLCFAFPAGHLSRNYPFVMGRVYDLDIGERVVMKEVSKH